MINALKKIPIRIKIIIPVLFGIIFAISKITFFSIKNSKQNIRESVENYLSLEVKTLIKMFEREKSLKTDKVISGLKVADNLYKSQKFEIENTEYETTAINQISKEKEVVKNFSNI